MNCLDFRRRWLTVPNARDLALAQHERSCAGCRQFARRGSVFEPKLREVLTVEVPVGLAKRIRQRRDIGEQVRARQARPLRYALALSLILLIALASLLGYEFLGPPLKKASLHNAVLQHIAAETEHLYERNDLRIAQLRPLFARFDVRLHGDLGPINFATACVIGRHQGIHMVMQGRQGPVTAIYMDGEYAKGRSRIRDERFGGVLLPVEGGAMAVVGERGEPVVRVAERVKRNLAWGA